MKNKKPLLLFADVEAGFGHLAPMSAIVSEFTRKYNDKVEILHKKVFTETDNPHILKMGKMQSKHPKRLGRDYVFRLGESISYALPSWFMLSILDRVFGKGRTEFIKELGRLKPEAVVSTYYLPTHLTVQANKKGLTNALTISYSPDTYVYPAWDRRVDMMLVNNERAKKQSIRRGFKEKNVKQVGFVYKRGAFTNASKLDARKRLGISDDEYVILITTGAYGCNKTVKLVEKILAKNISVNLQIVCGKDQKTFDKLTAIKNSGHDNLHVYQNLESLAPYMCACDLIIGKAGANTCNEARLYQKPMILFFEQSRIETEQAKYLVEKNIAIRQSNINKIISIISRDTAHRGDLRARLTGLDQQVIDGATQVADRIFDMLKAKGLVE